MRPTCRRVQSAHRLYSRGSHTTLGLWDAPARSVCAQHCIATLQVVNRPDSSRRIAHPLTLVVVSLLREGHGPASPRRSSQSIERFDGARARSLVLPFGTEPAAAQKVCPEFYPLAC